MIELSQETLTILMLSSILVGALTGFPLALVIGTVALVFGYIVFGNAVVDLLYQRAVNGILLNYIFLAAPLFIFMGEMLRCSGIAERLFDALYLLLGGVRGGLAIVTVLLGTIIAATVGIVAASVSMLTVVALPPMLKRGYNKSLAAGTVCASGVLGILIPPSIMLIIIGPVALISVGKLFFAAFMPGFLLTTLYIVYIVVASFFSPEIAPAASPEERGQVSFRKKTTALATSIVPPVVLILSVLGVIFFGIAPPTEAAGIGALVATLLTIANRRFSLRVLKEVSLSTLRFSSFVFLIVVMGFAFVGVFIGGGAGDVIREVVIATPGGKWGAFGVIMFITFILGFFIDWIAITFILIPVVMPIARDLGFDPLWFLMMLCINFQMSFITPPFAPAIFYVRGSAPPEGGVTMDKIIRGVIPFIFLIMVGLVLCFVFPNIILWLPSMMIR